MIENKLMPAFMNDSSDSDKMEEVVDYFISWTLRCSQIKYAVENQKLNFYSKQILSKILFENYDYLETNNINVLDLKVIKQKYHIDLIVDLKLTDDRRYLLVIENKVYGKLSTSQLNNYKNEVKKNYDKKKFKDILFIFLRGDDIFNDEDLELSKASDFQPILLRDLRPPRLDLTGNDFFDEFWIYWWDNEKYRAKI